MRVVHVLSSFGLGGQERMVLNLARAQKTAGHAVSVLSLAPAPDGPVVAEFEAAMVPTLREPKGHGFDLSLYWRLLRVFNEARPDVVHTHNPQPLIFAAAPAKVSGAAVVHTKHGVNPATWRRHTLRRVGAACADAVAAVSRATAVAAERGRDCCPAKLSVVPNGIDTEWFHPDRTVRTAVRRELGIPDDAWVAGTIGRLAREKNHELLLRSIAPLLGPSSHLLVVGDGPERARLRSHPDGTGAQVHWLGQRSDPERMLAAMDAFVMTSWTEGLPLVLAEAMSTRLPVVATAVGGIVDVVEHGTHGYLVEPGDERALREYLRRLRDDAPAARAMGRAARVRAVREYSSRKMAARYTEIYERVAAQRTRPFTAPVGEA